jgi:hypothetical protein
MTVAVDLLNRARRLGVEVQRRGDRLHLKAPAAPPDDLLVTLKQKKNEILEFLIHQARQQCQDEISSKEAISPACWVAELARLSPEKVPAEISTTCWRRFIASLSRFCDSGWEVKAEQLGWSAIELFGYHRDAPMGRLDCLGLVWFLEGGEIVGMSRETAIIRRMSGAKQTFRRSGRTHAHCKLPWE